MVIISEQELHASYDFVIVGGGTAGCVLAHRLSADSDTSVLVLEAGKHLPEDAKINTPGRFVELTDDPEYDWAFKTIPQKDCNNRVIAQTRGRVLGGSSALQYGMCVFPSKSSIDSWQDVGNPGWGWEDMVPYYRKFHTLQDPSPDIAQQLDLSWLNKETAGSSGPLKISYPGSDFVTPLHESWPKTFKNLEYASEGGDPMSGQVTGAYCNPCTVDATTKTRSYAASAYYVPISDRHNLHVLTSAHVARLVLEKDNRDIEAVPSATGVDFIYNGKKSSVGATREVLLCAGAIQSPQILELSGIGSAKVLRDTGIASLVELPGVGENLQDHCYCRVAFEMNDKLPAAKSTESVITQYEVDRTGPLTSTVICNAYMPLPEYLHSANKADAVKQRQHLTALIDRYTQASEAGFFPGQAEQYKALRAILENECDTTIQYRLAPFRMNAHMGSSTDSGDNQATIDFVSISATLSHPFSRGSVHIASADANDKPRLDPAYLSNPIDLEILTRHVAYCDTVARTAPLSHFIAENGRRVPAEPWTGDLEVAKETVRKSCATSFHPSSTCAMMPRDKGGVVNTQLKVYGTKKLRVCDASVFPLIPRGNIQSSVYAVAERAADLVLGKVSL